MNLFDWDHRLMEFSLCLFTFSKVTFCCIVFFSARTPPAPACAFILFFNPFNKLTVHTLAVYDNGKIKNNYLKFLMVLRTGSGRFVWFEVGYSVPNGIRLWTFTWLSNFAFSLELSHNKMKNFILFFLFYFFYYEKY